MGLVGVWNGFSVLKIVFADLGGRLKCVSRFWEYVGE